jgi:hypothetical protein
MNDTDLPTFDYRVNLFDDYGSYHYIVSAVSEMQARGLALRRARMKLSQVKRVEIIPCGSKESQE